MSTRVDTGELSVVSIASGSVLNVMENARIEVALDSVEGRSIVKTAESKQWVGTSGSVAVNSHSQVDVWTDVTHLNLTAISIDGQDYLTQFKSGSFKVSHTNKPAKAAGDAFQFPVPKTRRFQFNGIIWVPSSLTANPNKVFGSKALSTVIADKKVVTTFTINGTATTLPLLMVHYGVPFDMDGVQCVEIGLDSKGPSDSTAYPTASTGTTTLLEKAMNAFQTPLAYQIDSRSAAGSRWSGNMIWNGAEVAIDENNIIKESYNFLTQGVVTLADIA